MTSFLPWAKKTSEQSKLYSDVVRLKGFEPPTFWFVAKHSIQLSYSRISFCWRFHQPLADDSTIISQEKIKCKRKFQISRKISFTKSKARQEPRLKHFLYKKRL